MSSKEQQGRVTEKPMTGTKKPRPTRRHWSYTMTADGRVVISINDLGWLVSEEARTERERHAAALQKWYVEEAKLCLEPYLRGETFEQYKARTKSNG